MSYHVIRGDTAHGSATLLPLFLARYADQAYAVTTRLFRLNHVGKTIQHVWLDLRITVFIVHLISFPFMVHLFIKSTFYICRLLLNFK